MVGSEHIIKIIWGVALVLVGLCVFLAIPQKMIEIEKAGYFNSSMFFVRFSFYLISVLLIGGGCKKIYDNCRELIKAKAGN